MKNRELFLVLGMVLGCATAQAAQPQDGKMQQHPVSSPAKAAHAVPQGVGILKAVDASAGKVEIAHQPIAALKWPGMTMWFKLRTALPPGLVVGNSVHFELQPGAANDWVISRIEPGK